MKRMLINATQKEELRVALVDGQQLFDIDIESLNAKQKKSNIYKGKISRVEPSLEAVFVDYGAERHGFLPIKEVVKSYFSGSTATTEAGKPDYKKLLREGQEIIVQVDKEERGNKGAALTTYISLAGRYLVLMPNNGSGGGISRRIQGDERRALKDLLDQVDVPRDMSVIIRTAGVDRSPEELQWDLDYQIKIWRAIADEFTKAQVGALLYQESNIILRALRDYFRDDIAQILIDDDRVYQQAHAFMSIVIPDKLARLKHYQEELPLFTRYQIESQIDTAYGRSVRLPSGGELVIDYTEAMVSIDINSARSTKGGDVEETALHTNLEAAAEIGRQLRLRDIGGLVVIDFIDMYDNRHRRTVEDKLAESILFDRARVQMAKISKFGLLELSRQRLRPSIDEASHSVCPRCRGQGSIRSTQSIALSVLRLIEEDAIKENTAKVVAQLPVKVATFLLNEKREALSVIEKNNQVNIVIVANPTLETPHFEVLRIRDDDESLSEKSLSYHLARDFSQQDYHEDNQNQPAHEAQVAKVNNLLPSTVIPRKTASKLGLLVAIKRFFLDAISGKKTARKSTKSAGNANGRSSNKSRPARGDNTTRKPRNDKSRGDNRNDGRGENRSVAETEDNKERKNTRRRNERGNGRDNERSGEQRIERNERNDPSGRGERNERTDDNKPRQERKPRTPRPDNEVGKESNSSSNRRPRRSEPAKSSNELGSNPYMQDASKIRAGRPRSENATRGDGKMVRDIGQPPSRRETNRETSHTIANQSPSPSQITLTDSQHQPLQTAKLEATEAVWMPHAVNETNPGLFMSDDVNVPTNNHINDESRADKPIITTVVDSTTSTAPAPTGKNRFRALANLGQSVWYDNINRDMLLSGELNRLIREDDLRGVTSNPAIFEKALASNHPDYLSHLKTLQNQQPESTPLSAKQAFIALAVRDIQEACDALSSTYLATHQTDGMVSLEVSPDLANDAEATIAEALQLHAQLARDNAMIKVPATLAGLIAIEQLTYQGVNINVTLLFSLERYQAVVEAYIRGLEKRLEANLPIDDIRSVASFFISRIDHVVDGLLANLPQEQQTAIQGQVAIANAKLAYQHYQQVLQSPRWQILQTQGASLQRLLWASTGVKNPAYPATLYVDALIGKDTVNTIPPATYQAFAQSGTPALTLSEGLEDAQALIHSLPQYGINLDAITNQLEHEGVQAFEVAFSQLLALIEDKLNA